MVRRLRSTCHQIIPIAVMILFLSIGVSHSTEPSNPKTSQGKKSGKQAPTPSPEPIPQQTARVVDVLAGDLLKLEDNRLVKLLGISAYEPISLGWVDSLNPDRKRIAEEAVKRVRELVMNQEIRFQVSDIRPTGDARIWAYVTLPDGRLLNSLLLEEGLAQISPGTPEHVKSMEFKQKQQIAEQQKRNLWASDSVKSNSTDTTAEKDPLKLKVKPKNTSDDVPESIQEAHDRGIRSLFILGIAVCGLGYAIFVLSRRKKVCPMCYESVRKSATECVNCGYNFQTGYLGDDELQTWVTRNIRVLKNPGKKRK